MNNNLTTLGKRENAVFVLTPLYLVLFYFFNEIRSVDLGGLGLLFTVMYVIGLIVAIVSVLRFFRRIVLPSKILEYDDTCLYINKGFKGTRTIPWRDVRSVDNLHQNGDLSAIIYGLRSFKYTRSRMEMWQNIWKLSETGIIVINCKDELIRVHGIKNAREVRNELHRIISSKRRSVDNTLRMR